MSLRLSLYPQSRHCIYTQTGHPDQAKAEQQKLNQLAKSSNN
jgi:hypothetical protein